MDEHMMSNDLPYPRWQTWYRDALIELDEDKLMERVRQAECAIVDRLEALPSCRESLMELQAIEDALANLRCLRRETAETAERSKTDVYCRSFSGFSPGTGKKYQGE